MAVDLEKIANESSRIRILADTVLRDGECHGTRKVAEGCRLIQDCADTIDKAVKAGAETPEPSQENKKILEQLDALEERATDIRNRFEDAGSKARVGATTRDTLNDARVILREIVAIRRLLSAK